MTLFAYARSKAAGIALTLFGIISSCLIALTCACPPDAVALMAAVLALCSACAGTIDYLRSRRFHTEIRQLSESLEHPYQMHSLLSEPPLPDQALVYDALKAMGIASAEEVAEANAKSDEHREFVEGWVHGVKTPLASCELIAGRIPDPEHSQLIRELHKIRRSVDSALWYARSDCATNDYAIREVALVEIPRTACRECARYLIEQGCMPEFAIDESVRVFTDKKQVVFIVTQLVENAAKYGAHHLRFTSEQTKAESGAGSIALYVEDDGFGIPAADIGHVFERGFTGTRGREGTASTGMGLYLAARLCEQLGLGLCLSSVDGEGTCATLSFPLDRRRLDAQGDKTVSFA